MTDELERMKDEIRDGFKGLGVDIKFEADADLSGYRRGDRLLKYGELQEGMVVWGQYQEYGEDGPRADSPFRLETGNAEGTFILEDGSSFCLDIEIGDPDDECVEDCGEGVKRVYEAIRG